MSKISSSPQEYYDSVSPKVVVTIQYFLTPLTVTFMSSRWYMHSPTTSKICISSVDLTHSWSIYSLHSPTPPKSILP